jgi:hypothetical protein
VTAADSSALRRKNGPYFFLAGGLLALQNYEAIQILQKEPFLERE